MRMTFRNTSTLSLILSTVIVLALASAAYYLLVILPNESWTGLFPIVFQWIDLLFLLIGGGSLALLMMLFVRLVPSADYFYSDSVRLLADKLPLGWGAVFFLLNAFAEEVLFRGAIQEWLGLIPAALIFTVVHVAYYKKPLMLLYVLGTGLLLGLVYLCSGSLWICTLSHAFVNWLTIWMIKRGAIAYRPSETKIDEAKEEDPADELVKEQSSEQARQTALDDTANEDAALPDEAPEKTADSE